jgi:hypothetical protein
MKIELHTITACGFYQRGCKTPLFGITSEWLGDFLQWINQRINIFAIRCSIRSMVKLKSTVHSLSATDNQKLTQ